VRGTTGGGGTLDSSRGHLAYDKKKPSEQHRKGKSKKQEGRSGEGLKKYLLIRKNVGERRLGGTKVFSLGKKNGVKKGNQEKKKGEQRRIQIAPRKGVLDR